MGFLVKLFISQSLFLTSQAVVSNECGTKECCFYWPPDCSPLDQCKIIIRYVYSSANNLLSVEMKGKVSGWFAFGLSDKKGVMDGIKGEVCYYHKQVHLERFENEGTDVEFKGSVPAADTVFKAKINGSLICSYKRPLTGKNMYDIRIPHYLVASWGRLEVEKDENKVELHEHLTGAYFWTEKKVDLRTLKCGKIETTKWGVAAVHAGIMIFTWAGMASISALFARYSRIFWEEKTLFKQKIWFQLHRAVMLLAILFTFIGILVVFVPAGAWIKEMGAHPYTGISVLVLAFIQVSWAYLRPSKINKKRWIFDWGHRLLGILTIVLAFVTMFLGAAYMEVSVVALVLYITVGILLILAIELRERFVKETCRWTFNRLVDRQVRRIILTVAVICAIIFSIIMTILVAKQANKLAKITDE